MSNNEWKRKLDLAEREYTVREREWNDTRELLCSTITRLTRLYDFNSEEMNKHLNSIRNAVTGSLDHTQLESATRLIADLVLREDFSHNPDDSGSANPDHLTRLLIALLKEVPKDSSVALQLEIFVRELQGTINESNINSILSNLKDFLAEQIKLDAELSQKCSSFIVHVLKQLYERFDLKDDGLADLESLQIGMENSLNGQVWDSVLTKVTEVVEEVRQRLSNERNDTEQFLVQITDRLSDLEKSVLRARDFTDEALEKGNDFNELMRKEFAEISHSLESTFDINVLKDRVKERIETLDFHLNLFCEEELARNETARDQVKVLIGLLKDMDSEASTLRQRIKRQRVKALIDPLTAIPNRMAYMEKVSEELALWRRYKQPFTMVVWDIDFFKKINDAYGHIAGDNALKSVATLLKDNLRQSDFLARYGGEEFVLLMPNTSMHQAREAAEKLRELVASSKFHFQGQPVAINVSAGIAQFSEGDTDETVFDRADAALYRAKQEGRNRVVTSE